MLFIPPVPCSKLYQADESDLSLLKSQAFSQISHYSPVWAEQESSVSAPGYPSLYFVGVEGATRMLFTPTAAATCHEWAHSCSRRDLPKGGACSFMGLILEVLTVFSLHLLHRLDIGVVWIRCRVIPSHCQ